LAIVRRSGQEVYATKVVEKLDPSRHSEIGMSWDGIAHITAIMEMITYSPRV